LENTLENGNNSGGESNESIEVPEDQGPPREHDPVWRGMFPSRNTFTFDNGLIISSEFESGNLFRCEQSDFAPLPVPPPTEKKVIKKKKAKKEVKEGENGDPVDLPAEEEDLTEDLETKTEDTEQPEDPKEESKTDTKTEAIGQNISGLDIFQPVEDDVYGFDIWLCHDGMPYTETCKNRAQFFFSVTGLPEVTSPEKRRVLRFRVRNMTV